jgi:hypothetical protein
MKVKVIKGKFDGAHVGREKINLRRGKVRILGHELTIRRGEVIGKCVDGEPKNEADHFVKCGCGAWVDRRDLAHVLDHIGPLPHPPEHQPH